MAQKEIIQDKHKSMCQNRWQTRIFAVVQNMRCISVIVSCHLTEMICYVKCYSIITCIFIVLAWKVNIISAPKNFITVVHALLHIVDDILGYSIYANKHGAQFASQEMKKKNKIIELSYRSQSNPYFLSKWILSLIHHTRRRLNFKPIYIHIKTEILCPDDWWWSQS